MYGSAENTAAKPSWTSRTPESGATLELRQTSEMDGFGFESFCLLLVMATEMEPPEPCLPEQPLSHWTKREVKK